MGALDGLLDQVKQAITQHNAGGGGDTGTLLGRVTDLFMNHPHNQPSGNVKPASKDPYGDPANVNTGSRGAPDNVKPASADPYGDPADQKAR